MQFFITGDKHGDFDDFIENFSRKSDLKNTGVIILGDRGLNYYLNDTDKKRKERLNKVGCVWYLVRGNHEERPENISTMSEVYDPIVKNNVYQELEYPYIKYLKDGEVYYFGKYKTLVIGGAYSIDKEYRLLRAGYSEKDELIADPKKCGWFKDEQLTAEEMMVIEKRWIGQSFDFILTHTCPYSWRPTDLFLPSIDQSKVDSSMEKWLDSFKDKINWKIFCWGHYHVDRSERPYCEIFYKECLTLDSIWTHWNSIKSNSEKFWRTKGPNFYLTEKIDK